MKKYLAFLLCFVMIFSLISCTAEEPKKEVETKEEATQEELEGSGNISVPRAKIEELTYTSSYNGITLTLPEDPAWSFTSDEELAKELKIPVGALSADLGTTLLQGTAIKDMEATNGAYGSEMYIYYELSLLTADAFLDKQLEKLYDLPGISFDDKGEKGTSTIAEKEYASTVVECESAGTSMTCHYYVRKGDDGVITFIYVNLFESDPTDVAALFN